MKISEEVIRRSYIQEGMVRFAQFVHFHRLNDQEIQDDYYLLDLLDNFTEENDDNPPISN